MTVQWDLASDVAAGKNPFLKGQYSVQFLYLFVTLQAHVSIVTQIL